MRRGLLVAALVASAVVAAPPGAEAAPECDWPTYGHDVGRSFAATPGCSTLNPTNAATLIPKWLFRTSTPVSASPAVVGGIVYVGDWGGTFYALDAASGAQRWAFHIDDTNTSAFGRIVSSAAVASVGGRQVVLFGGGATLYALDALTGAKLAALCLDPRDIGDQRCHAPEDDVEVESSPAIVTVAGEQRVLIGLDVHNGPNIGRTGLVQAALRPTAAGVDLVPIWKFDPEAGAAYTGPDLLTRGSGTGSGCASVWSSPAVDVGRNLVVFGTGSCPVDGVTVGEHIWALGLDDGQLVWAYGPPRTSTRLDDDFGASPNMLPGGLVGEGGKDGWYYALRARPAGAGPELVWATQVSQPGHLTTDFAVGGMIGTPATGAVGGVPAIFVASAIPTPLDRPLDDNPSIDTTLLADPQRLMSLTALRASDGAILWRNVLARPSYGAPSFVNGVVLVPSTFTFSLQAFDANTGVLLATRPLAGPPSSSPVALGDSVYLGTGTSQTSGASDPLAPLSGVYAFRIPSLTLVSGLGLR